MPRLLDYSSTEALQGLRPSEAGVEAAVQAGRRTGAFYSQSGQERAAAANEIGGAVAFTGRTVGEAVQEHLNQQEVTQFYAKQAQFDNELVTSWNKTRNEADPNDPTVATKWNQEVLQPAVDKFTSEFSTPSGQQRVQEHVARLQEHLGTVQAADASTAAGEAALQNLSKFNANNAASLTGDPSRLDFVNATTDKMIDDYIRNSPSLSSERAAEVRNMGTKMRRENTLAAFHGMADANPTAAKQALDSGYGKDDLTESDRNALSNYTHVQEQRVKEEARAEDLDTKRKNVAAASDAMNSLFADHIDPDSGTLKVGPGYFKGVVDIAKMPDAPPSDVRTAFSYGQVAMANEASGKFVQTDPNLREDFSTRMALPPGDPKALTPSEILQAGIDQKMSNADVNKFYKEATELAKDPVKRDALSQYNKFVASMKSSITHSNPLLGKIVPQEDQKFGQFQYDSRLAFDQAYASGNWRAALDPRSANYLGHMLPQYTYGSKEGLQTLQTNLKSGVTLAPAPNGDDGKARKPGESPADYIKRTGG